MCAHHAVAVAFPYLLRARGLSCWPAGGSFTSGWFSSGGRGASNARPFFSEIRYDTGKEMMVQERRGTPQ